MAGISLGHQNLIKTLQGSGYLKTTRVTAVMAEVDRSLFCRVHPYVDTPQSIGHGATISAPHMHATALELLADRLVEGAAVLDIGSGSGYLTACMSIMVGETGRVIGIEHVEELVSVSKSNISRLPKLADRLRDGRLQIIVGDGRLGYLPSAPYDVMHVGAAVPHMPTVLLSQLRPGTGRMVVPVGYQPIAQKLVQFDRKLDGSIVEHRHMSVAYVPLTRKTDQTASA